jgi:RHS repeat-associated protein
MFYDGDMIWKENVQSASLSGGGQTYYYLTGHDVDEWIARQRLGDTGTEWFLAQDRNIRASINDDGQILSENQYTAYGVPITGSGICRPQAASAFGFTGREYDPETGLYYYRARYFDPHMGRFISEDPIGFEAGDANLYRYAGNSPQNYHDPYGKQIMLTFAVFWYYLGFAMILLWLQEADLAHNLLDILGTIPGLGE